jgi:sugar (pentulose or hexulose) kinase
MSLLIGIDVGSSSIKGIVANGPEIIRAERTQIPARIETEDHLSYEHNANEIRDATFELIRRLASGQQIRGIAFTGQMHGGLLVDGNLAPITNIVTWQDRRNNVTMDSLRAALGDDCTGVGIHPGFLVSTLANWIADDKLPASSAFAIGIYDWMASLLLGQAVTDIASAAAWGMYDPIRRQWRAAVLNVAGIPSTLLPKVYEPGESIGLVSAEMADRLGLSPGVVVFAGTGDTQASYVGSGCKRGDLLLNVGTGSQSMWETDRPEKSMGVDIRYLAAGRWLATSPTEAGGEAYRALAEFVRDIFSRIGAQELSLEQVYDRLNNLGGVDSEGILFDPAFAGSKVRNVKWARIDGLTRANFRIAPMTSALFEGMVAEISGPYFRREGNRKPNKLIAGGSAMRLNPALRMAAERIFGMPIELPTVEFEAAYGVTMQSVLEENGR